MSAADVTPERFAELRLLEKHLCASGQMVGACLRESLAALESAWAERDAYLDEVRMTNENEARIMADLLATREERDKLRAELDRLRSAPVAVEVPPLDSGANPNQRGLEHPGSGGWLMHQTYLDGYNAARKAARSIPYYRILKEGMVAIRADVLSAMDGCIATLRADDELIPSKALDYLDALRSKGSE